MSPWKRRRSHRRERATTYLAFFAGFAVIVYASHVSYFSLPLFWDELGYFVPAALELYQQGHWLPRTVAANIHPPGLAAYLAGVWSLTGYSILATRLAMPLLASLWALVSFLLAIELCRNAPGAPAIPAAVFLLATPLVYTQSMMAQLDMPAALFTALGLLLFLRDRYALAAAACTALVLVKETGLLLPLILGVWLAVENRFRQAALFLVPAGALAAWLVVLRLVTGSPFGDPDFAAYNILYPLHPVRFGVALLRRLFQLFVADFRWIGALFLVAAFRRSNVFAGRAWLLAGIYAGAHVLLVSAFGGAHLERYLLPVLPIVYAGMAAAMSVVAGAHARLGRVGLIAGLLAGFWWNPPYPFPFENNLAMIDTVRLHREAAEYLERHLSSRTIVTAWPLSEALRRPEFGYVAKPLAVRGLKDFSSSRVAAQPAASLDVLVLYSRDWDSDWNPLRDPLVRAFWRRFFDFREPIGAEECRRLFDLATEARWESGGQWIEILVRSGPAAANWNPSTGAQDQVPQPVPPQAPSLGRQRRAAVIEHQRRAAG